jgi:hypothetical protein
MTQRNYSKESLGLVKLRSRLYPRELELLLSFGGVGAFPN